MQGLYSASRLILGGTDGDFLSRASTTSLPCLAWDCLLLAIEVELLPQSNIAIRASRTPYRIYRLVALYFVERGTGIPFLARRRA